MVKLLNHYVLFYLRWVDLLNILKTKKKYVIFGADDDVILKQNRIWKKVKKLLSVEFVSQLVYDDKYIKARVKTFENKVITKFTENKISK